MIPPSPFPVEIQELIASFCPRSSQELLLQVPSLQRGAFNVFHRECSDLVPLLRDTCHDMKGIPPANHSTCLGRPQDKNLEDTLDLLQATCGRIRRLQLHEDQSQHCSRCFHYACKRLLELKPTFNLLPALRSADVQLISSYWIITLDLFPNTLSVLHLSALKADVNASRILSHLPRFTALKELHLNTRRDEEAGRYNLRQFFSVAESLETFHVYDFLPMDYTRQELSQFLKSHQDLTSLALTPFSGRVPPSELPELDCLDSIFDQPGRSLREFRALLNLDGSTMEDLRGYTPYSSLKVLDLGWSRSSADPGKTKSYIRSRFPRVIVRAMSTGVSKL